MTVGMRNALLAARSFFEAGVSSTVSLRGLEPPIETSPFSIDIFHSRLRLVGGILIGKNPMTGLLLVPFIEKSVASSLIVSSTTDYR
jgi:hypothetical protein